MSSDSDSDQGEQVRISLKLASSVQDRSLEVPTQPIAVPADIGRKGLSAVLNHLLGRRVVKEKADSDEEESDSDDEEDGNKLPPLSFEFVVAGTNNRLLRKGVEKEARQHGVSLEEAISITYFPAASAPEMADDKEQLPDWISSLSCQESLLCAGCYDGTIHLYDFGSTGGESLSKLHSWSTSAGPIKTLKMKKIQDQLWVASASLDHSLYLHSYQRGDEEGLELIGQCMQEEVSSPMSSLDFASSASKPLLASGDGNGTICIWDIGQAVSNDEDADMSSSHATKKKKTSSLTKTSSSTRMIKPKISMESSHSQLVSGLSWGNHASDNCTHLTSGGWDHAIKHWDVERQDCLITLNGSRVVSCLDTSYHSEGVVATGHPDCTVRLWDVRVHSNQQSAVVSDTTFRPSHKAWVSAVHWSRTNAYHLASASHDGTVKVWDIRSNHPLHTVRAFPKEAKALCLAWASSDPSDKSTSKQRMFTGGTDCMVKQLQFSK